jgi:predicted 3-demethylubiquinone-9 3-methyltransferase (glyoxalase superfamily)
MRFMMLMIPRVYQAQEGRRVPAEFAPSSEAVERMTRYNERLAQAGALVAGDGLHPAEEGARVSFQGGKAQVIDGPFTESKEVLGGYWMIQAKSRQEAVAWAKQCPADEGDVIEVRQVFDSSEWPEDVRKAAQSSTLQGALERQRGRVQRITPFLWFDSNAEEAIELYTSVFRNSRIVSVSRYDEAGAKASGMPKGTVMTATFELEGQQFMALNGRPHFKFSEAISFFVRCDTQKEVDELWKKLSAGGEEGQCGWLKDRFGVSWQIVPAILGELLSDPDPEKSKRVMTAMLQMKKLDIEALKHAAEKGA